MPEMPSPRSKPAPSSCQLPHRSTAVPPRWPNWRIPWSGEFSTSWAWMLPTLADGGSRNLPAETRGSPEGIRQFALTVTMASPAEVLLLSAAAVLAGAMNAIAGGGTILTFPALLAFGMPAVQANATSTVALLVGAIGSAYGYREHLPAASLWIRRFGLVSIAGGFLRCAASHEDSGGYLREARSTFFSCLPRRSS